MIFLLGQGKFDFNPKLGDEKLMFYYLFNIIFLIIFMFKYFFEPFGNRGCPNILPPGGLNSSRGSNFKISKKDRYFIYIKISITYKFQTPFSVDCDMFFISSHDFSSR